MRKLNEHSIQVIDEIVKRHTGRPGPIKLMLHDVQHELGYIPFEAMEKIAVASGTSVAEVYGVVTFYAQFTTQPKGKHVINVCLGTACYVKGAQQIIDDLLAMTKAPVNGTSPDGLFSLDATRCVGACGLAPVVIIDGEVFGSANQSSKVMDTIVSIKLKEGM
ncbi:MAG: NAD(P)H-dependent oxidoreductase subunit E [Erysipelotrichaceae bacterium]|jgi:NADH:ubiquinone oxidoreductase subunit E|nr:NAD(P)H-dependent oxidoreductase subunit E [Erysipelotrichaceae bacterium]MBQ9841094.1 NAD(P)H-dependent oxidoreductase subunit E [Erysipelotrichaceae bacterium]MBR5795720.1 NAD(P)H-dependent oxidoreductase subunit E [Erysipelotrichaceae bacterium]